MKFVPSSTPRPCEKCGAPSFANTIFFSGSTLTLEEEYRWLWICQKCGHKFHDKDKLRLALDTELQSFKEQFPNAPLLVIETPETDGFSIVIW